MFATSDKQSVHKKICLLLCSTILLELTVQNFVSEHLQTVVHSHFISFPVSVARGVCANTFKVSKKKERLFFTENKLFRVSFFWECDKKTAAQLTTPAEFKTDSGNILMRSYCKTKLHFLISSTVLQWCTLLALPGMTTDNNFFIRNTTSTRTRVKNSPLYMSRSTLP